MKKTHIIIGIVSILGIVWYFTKKNTNELVGPVTATYIGGDQLLGTNDMLTKGETISGDLNNDGTLSMYVITSWSKYVKVIPAIDIINIKSKT